MLSSVALSVRSRLLPSASVLRWKSFSSLTQKEPVTLAHIRKLYEHRKPLVAFTVYDYPGALAVDKSNADLAFIDLSMAGPILGYSSPAQITIEDMIHHSKAVANGVSRAFTVADLPFGCSELDSTVTLDHVTRLMSEGLVKGIKVRDGVCQRKKLVCLVDAGVPVVGHISYNSPTLSMKNSSAAKAEAVLNSAREFEESGAFAVVLEQVPDTLMKYVTSKLSIPTLRFRSEAGGNGTMGDLPALLGLSRSSAKQVGEKSLYADIVEAYKQYATSVVSRTFPVTKL
eukprot:Ihof_evm5s228 gene=Ihof_evmTU5s228